MPPAVLGTAGPPSSGAGGSPAHAVGLGVFRSCHPRVSSAAFTFHITAQVTRLTRDTGLLRLGEGRSSPGTLSQKGYGVRKPRMETSRASVLAAGARRWLPARARFAEQVEPSDHFSTPQRSRAVLAATDSAVPPREASPADPHAPKVLRSGVSALAFGKSHHQTSIVMLKCVPSCRKTCSGGTTRNHGTAERSVLPEPKPLPAGSATARAARRGQCQACVDATCQGKHHNPVP